MNQTAEVREEKKQNLAALTPCLSVSLLASDVLHLEDQVDLLVQNGVKLLHFDVMDGNFVNNITVGAGIIGSVPDEPFRDVHLIVANPIDQIEPHIKAGADILTIHLESEPKHIHRVFQAIDQASSPDRGQVPLRGLALNPGTPVELITPLFHFVDLVKILAVNPGWSGQDFITEVGNKVSRVRKLALEAGEEVLISLDGGIRQENFSEVVGFKPDIVCSGSAVFKNGQTAQNIEKMNRQLANINGGSE